MWAFLVVGAVEDMAQVEKIVVAVLKESQKHETETNNRGL